MSVNQVMFSLTLTPDDDLRNFIELVKSGKIKGGGGTGLDDRDIQQIKGDIRYIANVLANMYSDINRSSAILTNIEASLTSINLPSPDRNTIMRTFKDLLDNLKLETGKIISGMSERTKKSLVTTLGGRYGVSTPEEVVAFILKELAARVSKSVDQETAKKAYEYLKKLRTGLTIDVKTVHDLVKFMVGRKNEMLTEWVFGKREPSGFKSGAYGMIGVNIEDLYVRAIEDMWGSALKNKNLPSKGIYRRLTTPQGVRYEEIGDYFETTEKISGVMDWIVENFKEVDEAYSDAKKKAEFWKSIRKEILGRETPLPQNVRIKGISEMPEIIIESLYGSDFRSLLGAGVVSRRSVTRTDVQMYLKESMRDTLSQIIEEEGDRARKIEQIRMFFGMDVTKEFAEGLIDLYNKRGGRLFFDVMEKTGAMEIGGMPSFSPGSEEKRRLEKGAGIPSPSAVAITSRSASNEVVHQIKAPLDIIGMDIDTIKTLLETQMIKLDAIEKSVSKSDTDPTKLKKKV